MSKVEIWTLRSFLVIELLPGPSSRCDHSSWFLRLELQRAGDSLPTKWKFSWGGTRTTDHRINAQESYNLAFLTLEYNYDDTYDYNDNNDNYYFHDVHGKEPGGLCPGSYKGREGLAKSIGEWDEICCFHFWKETNVRILGWQGRVRSSTRSKLLEWIKICRTENVSSSFFKRGQFRALLLP